MAGKARRELLILILRAHACACAPEGRLRYHSQALGHVQVHAQARVRALHRRSHWRRACLNVCLPACPRSRLCRAASRASRASRACDRYAAWNAQDTAQTKTATRCGCGAVAAEPAELAELVPAAGRELEAQRAGNNAHGLPAQGLKLDALLQLLQRRSVGVRHPHLILAAGCGTAHRLQRGGSPAAGG